MGSWFNCCVKDTQIKALPEGITNILSEKALKAIELLQMSADDVIALHFKYTLIPKNTFGQVSVESFMKHYDFKQKVYISAIFAPFDESGDGSFGFSEFILALGSYGLFTRLDMMRHLFRLFDSDGSGYIEMDELQTLIEAVHSGDPLFPTAISQAILIYDADGDGKVDFEEFCAADRTFPMLLWPAFRIQEALRKYTLGLPHFERLMEELHPEMYVGDPTVEYNERVQTWELLKIYALYVIFFLRYLINSCFIDCLKFCFDPNFTYETWKSGEYDAEIEQMRKRREERDEKDRVKEEMRKIGKEVESDEDSFTEISIESNSENQVDVIEDDRESLHDSDDLGDPDIQIPNIPMD